MTDFFILAVAVFLAVVAVRGLTMLWYRSERPEDHRDLETD